jgi:deoxyadenosine/deoxycytidine kinase
LHELYEAWFERYSDSPKIVIPTDRVDYVEQLFDRQELLQEIRSRLS